MGLPASLPILPVALCMLSYILKPAARGAALALGEESYALEVDFEAGRSCKWPQADSADNQ